jgi:hypothetical protein
MRRPTAFEAIICQNTPYYRINLAMLTVGGISCGLFKKDSDIEIPMREEQTFDQLRMAFGVVDGQQVLYSNQVRREHTPKFLSTHQS